MRKDMDKVLVERERHGHWRKYHDHRPRISQQELKALADDDFDDGRVRSKAKPIQSMKNTYGHDTKMLNENLSPLKRFLEANIGRKWDDVFSEMNEHINPRNTVQQHILSHVYQYVEEHVVLRGAEACRRSAGRWYGKSNKRDDGLIAIDGMYIHPITGILCYQDRSYKAAAKARRKKLVQIKEEVYGKYPHRFTSYILVDGVYMEALSDYEKNQGLKPINRKIVKYNEHEYAQWDGIWYKLKFGVGRKPVLKIDKETGKEYTVQSFHDEDIVRKHSVRPGEIFRKSRTQASKEDMKRHGLVNEYAEPDFTPEHIKNAQEKKRYLAAGRFR